jgi:hypothetical protein
MLRRAAQPAIDLNLRSVRPSLLDRRFSGDPWIVDQGNGTFALCLGDYHLVWFEGLAVDLPALNRLYHGMRRRRPRQPKKET